MDWNTIIVGVGSGALTGTITALCTPWAQWAVEVRKNRQANRLKFLEDWVAFVKNFHMDELPTSSRLPSLIRFLSPPARQKLEILMEDYDAKWTEFERKSLPRIQQESRNYGVNRDRFVDDAVNSEKEKLDKPIQDFLFRQIAELREKWKLL